MYYENGEGVEKNSTKAAQFCSKACNLNNSWGCGYLGFLYEYGQGVEKDLKKAAYFYSKACKLGEQLACESLKELR
ncbi:sel1 repeat family protein [Helicobacter pylori]|nr:sel1 repeat family protein [Helicobacter pylori]